MQRLTVTLLAFLSFAFFISSCDKKSERPPDRPASEGIITDVGTSDGTPASTKTIGAAGGTIASTNGRLKLSVPAGALNADQSFSIQSISNHNPMAVNSAYRLEPHNIQFSKPVTLEFTYDEDDIQHSIPEALGIAYQNEKGIWMAQRNVVLDKAAKTIKVTTTHFSDWALFESFSLLASSQSVTVDENITLEVFTAEDFLTSPAGEQVPIGKKVLADPSWIKSWELAGAGTLEETGAMAIYQAPATVPSSPNPVGISVRLKLPQRGEHILLAHIKIVGGEFIEVKANGTTYVLDKINNAFYTDGNVVLSAYRQGNPPLGVSGITLELIQVNVPGTYPYGDYNTGDPQSRVAQIRCNFVTNTNQSMSLYTYLHPGCWTSGNATHSTGVVKLTQFANVVGDYFEGTFEATTLYNNNTGCSAPISTDVTKLAEGKFRIKRTQ